MPNISDKPIAEFLDAVDSVLNSNTFLLQYSPTIADISEALSSFIRSDDFTTQLIHQDAAREWHNLHLYNYDTDTYTVRPGILVKPGFQLTINNPPVEKREYIIAMLTADQKVDNFFSPYQKQLPGEKAELLADNFLKHITKGSDWELRIVRPDFLYTAADTESDEHIRYFEGEHASDTATLLICKQQHYLLLTNGID